MKMLPWKPYFKEPRKKSRKNTLDHVNIKMLNTLAGTVKKDSQIAKRHQETRVDPFINALIDVAVEYK